MALVQTREWGESSFEHWHSLASRAYDVRGFCHYVTLPLMFYNSMLAATLFSLLSCVHLQHHIARSFIKHHNEYLNSFDCEPFLLVEQGIFRLQNGYSSCFVRAPFSLQKCLSSYSAQPERPSNVLQDVSRLQCILSACAELTRSSTELAITSR